MHFNFFHKEIYLEYLHANLTNFRCFLTHIVDVGGFGNGKTSVHMLLLQPVCKDWYICPKEMAVTKQHYLFSLQSLRWIETFLSKHVLHWWESGFENLSKNNKIPTQLTLHILPLPFPGACRQFEAVDSNPKALRTLDTQSQIENVLRLKVGAQVSMSVSISVMGLSIPISPGYVDVEVWR